MQRRETATYNQHIFIRKTRLQKQKDVRMILKSQELITPLFLHGAESCISVGDYLKELIAFEKQAAAKTGHAGKFTILDAYTVMLPEGCSRMLYEDFAESIIQDTHGGDKLPHFVTLWHEGAGTFLTVYFSARDYYPEGQSVELKAPADSYRNAAGLHCRPDAAGAVLVRKKGDIIRTINTKFSLTKSDLFHMPAKEFYRVISRMKKHIAQLITEIGKAPAFILPRFAGESFKFRRMKKGCTRINKILAQWEKRLNEIYGTVCEIWGQDMLNTRIQKLLHQIYAALFPVTGGPIGFGTHQRMYLSFDYCSEWHWRSTDLLNWFLETAIDQCFAQAQQEGIRSCRLAYC